MKKFLSFQLICLTITMLVSSCTDGTPKESRSDVDSPNNPSEVTCAGGSTCTGKTMQPAENSQPKEDSQITDHDKYTGVWLFTISGKSTESDEKTGEVKGQKLVLITQAENNKVSIDSCDGLDIFGDPTDMGFKVISGTINETRQNAVGNNITFTFNFNDDNSASGTSHFTEGSFASHETIEAVKLSASPIFEKQGSDLINLGVLITKNKPATSDASSFSINCFSISEAVTYYIKNDKKQVNVIINEKDQVIKSIQLSVQGIDLEGNELLVHVMKTDTPTIFPSIVFITYKDTKSIEHSVNFFILDNEKRLEDTSVKAQIYGTIDIDDAYASIDVIANDEEGNSAAVDFSLHYQKPLDSP